ncbi:MAG: IS200/IS605 family transposase [Candidatus Korobacteraceae bacterium]
MSHSLCRSLFHIVFGTKQRRDYIPKSSLENTWAYIAGIARNHDMRVFAVGGTQNHIHALVELSPELAPAAAVRTLKCNSSRWLRESVPLFQWQQGYGAFSVSPSQLGRVVNYISHQAQHHARYSFEEEFRSILKAAGINRRFDDYCVAPEGAPGR